MIPAQNGSTARSAEWLAALGLSLACGLVIVLPFLLKGNASGHDIQFHAASWLDVAGQWTEGVLFPRWAVWANHGFGEPRFIFYPPLSWLLGAAIGSLVSWKAAVGLYVVAVLTLAGSSAYGFLRRTMTHGQALFGALCFAANPYALLIVYMRSDYAELLAMAFFPWLIAGALELSGLSDAGRGAKRGIALFAVSYAAVWLANAPAGVVASYALALVFLWAAVSGRSLQPLVRGGSGILLGLGLSGFYLVPAAYEQRWVSISDALSFGLHPSENFLFTSAGDPEHVAFNWIASKMAVLLIGIAGAAAAVVLGRKSGRDGRTVAKTVAVLLAAATLLMLPPTLFLWEHLPKLKFVQFPWRWMSIVAVGFAWFLSAAAEGRRWRPLWAAGVVAVLVGASLFLVKSTWWDSDDIPALRAAIEAGKGFEGTDEYDPLGDDHTSIPETAPRVAGLTESGAPAHMPAGNLKILGWGPERKVVEVRGARYPLVLALRLINYPAWEATVNGAPVAIRQGPAFAQMWIPVPAGDSRVEVVFGRTRDRTVGALLSLLSFALAAWLWFAARAPRL